MTESTLSDVTPLASNAALFVRTDISVAVRSFILPPNAPNGVLLAATMKVVSQARLLPLYYKGGGVWLARLQCYNESCIS